MSEAAVVFFLFLLALGLQMLLASRAGRVRAALQQASLAADQGEQPRRPAAVEPRRPSKPAPAPAAVARPVPTAPAFLPVRGSLRRAIVMMELLGPPRALRPPPGR